MAQIAGIQTEIETLSDEDFARLREWFAEKDAAERDTAEDDTVEDEEAKQR